MSIIVYNRQLKETDFQDFCDQIIFFKDSNIAYIIVEKEKNPKLTDEELIKTTTKKIKRQEEMKKITL